MIWGGKNYYTVETAKVENLFRVEEDKKDKPLKKRLERRLSEQIIIAFCGPIGSNIKAASKAVEDALRKFKYEVVRIKVSDLIIENSEKISESIGYKIPLKKEELKGANRYFALQNAGNELRKQYGHSILGELIIKSINHDRVSRARKGETSSDNVIELADIKSSHRVAYLIDSLKHPAEVEILRAVYRNSFYLLGILCVEDVRVERLKRDNVNGERIKADEADILIARDKNEVYDYGQKLIKTLQYADFFVTNNKDESERLQTQLSRFFDLVFGVKIITPTKHEYAMYMAQSAAASSGCISRQIGAVILNDRGDITASGYNDVPKPFGGLYVSGDTNDSRCCVNGKFCRNDDHKDDIKKDIQKILSEELSPYRKKSGKKLEDLAQKISTRISKETRLKDLIEFSRAVHAEMETIISAARTGSSTIGCSLYTTTFPCHNCARHIIAAGITNVYYIEPYEKSLAFELHKDSIVLEPFLENEGSKEDEKHGKVIFAHFEGVAPRQYLNLFYSKAERKMNGKAVELPPSAAKPVNNEYLESWLEIELKISGELEKQGFREKINIDN